MIFWTLKKDEILRDRLVNLSQTNHNYWSFKGNSDRDHGHGLFQYPAMMVPQMVRSILEQACVVHPEIENVSDPFVGSGTSLTESMLRGLGFSGTDINPLAMLLCRVKAGPFYIDALAEKVLESIARIEEDTGNQIEVNFKNRDKWFEPYVQVDLSKIRRSILCENSTWARRFLWIGLAEAVRLTCNSRTSTFKLHIRSRNDIKTRNYNAIGIFKKAVNRNLEKLKNQTEYLREKGYLNRGHYKNIVNINLNDTLQFKPHTQSDIIITSPPYGDNSSTVTYGQYSYLPLQWIELKDIDRFASDNYLCSTNEIDFRSLGGSKRIKECDRQSLVDKSPTLKHYLKLLNGQPVDRANRVTAFFRDLYISLDPILNGLNTGGLIIWILGNRKVGGIRVPLDKILLELLTRERVIPICKLTRDIFSKRMALKNNIASTISTEAILVMRKA